MCGIAGWLRRPSGPDVDPATLAAMRDLMRHRGPDGQGLWMDEARGVGLAFRRLAIVDLAANAGQPMANEDGSVRVVFNGEIYNHATLRRELQDLGHRFATDHSDTEAIVHGYEQWGCDVLAHLDGMFAIGIWDAGLKRLLIARDRVGVKPLYFTRCGGAFLFASEIKALLAHDGVPREMDAAALRHYLSFMVPPAPLTLFKGIYKLPAGWSATIDGDTGAVTTTQWWDAMPQRPDASDDPAPTRAQVVDEVRSLLDRAVRKRLMADVPLGVLLSGGIDSSAITALVRRHATGPVRTFTVGFSDHTGLNELAEARQVARQFETEHLDVQVDAAAMRAYLPELVVTQDEPIADWVCVPLYFVSKLVRDSGTIVTLVGEGADEEFCGYRSYMGYLQLHDRYWNRWRRAPGALRRMAAIAAAGIGTRRPELALYADIPQRLAHGREMFWGGAVAFWESQKDLLVRGAAEAGAPAPSWLGAMLPDSFLDGTSHEVVRHHLATLEAAAPDADLLARMTYLEFKQRLPELLLMRVDKITMSTSVEARVPFLDPALVRYTMSLPRSTKVPGGRRKDLLKAACRGLIPDEVIDREKRGFGAPMAEWLREDFGRDAEATILRSRLVTDRLLDRARVELLFDRHRRGGDTSVPLWTLYNLAAWHERWLA